MGNGLIMTLDEFEALPQKQQLSCLYQNQVKTMDYIKGYKLYYKITTIIGSFLVAGMGILFSFHLG